MVAVVIRRVERTVLANLSSISPISPPPHTHFRNAIPDRSGACGARTSSQACISGDPFFLFPGYRLCFPPADSSLKGPGFCGTPSGARLC